MDTPITRAEHEEFCKRMEDEHKRISHRLGNLEDAVRQIGELTASVQSLAQSVEQIGSESVTAGEPAGRIRRQRWRDMAEGQQLCTDSHHRRSINICFDADRHQIGG